MLTYLNFKQEINFTNFSTPVDSNQNKFSWLNIYKFKYEKELHGLKFLFFYRPCSPSIHKKANCIAISWTGCRPHTLASCHFSGDSLI